MTSQFFAAWVDVRRVATRWRDLIQRSVQGDFSPCVALNGLQESHKPILKYWLFKLELPNRINQQTQVYDYWFFCNYIPFAGNAQMGQLTREEEQVEGTLNITSFGLSFRPLIVKWHKEHKANSCPVTSSIETMANNREANVAYYSIAIALLQSVIGIQPTTGGNRVFFFHLEL